MQLGIDSELRWRVMEEVGEPCFAAATGFLARIRVLEDASPGA
jgi:hypothetical protein